MEWRELNGIPIYLADVEVLAHLFYMRGGNMVCSAPHAPGGIMLDFAIRLLAGGILSAFVYGEQGGYGRGSDDDLQCLSESPNALYRSE